MERKNLIFLYCILISIVILSFIFTYDQFFSSYMGEKIVLSESSSVLELDKETSTSNVHIPKKIGTVTVRPGEVKNVNIENSKNA